MTVYEMEGFLRGKCLPGDMMVNEGNAQYLVRKFSELQSQNADLAVQLANAESKCRELAAELSSVDKIHNEAVFITDDHYGQCPPEVQKMIRSLAVLQIPAYAAFLAEVRAQVWIEGSEPEEFGRYWVRYETDMGPQYCSAKWMEHNFCAGSNTNIHKIWLADHSRSINSLRGVTHYTKLPDSLEGAAK
ncbi:hypothetical protein DCU91_001001 [Salmonella enterica subsp. enterica]|uniref:Ead/Ea22-like family protein n=1 Tax=Salmonella enterica TaxID=28901 RepID=A0A622D2B9_SALER|nr:hypothetical protein [Salmonella enterica subsp. enterica serovar Alachua]ECY8988007.1 hypothetical protein [Salmonella enterica subsp. enterica serovar Alachua]EDT2447343.1 hypothetical protein [Salmonella enterica subsp. enterica]EDU0983563.1 hypothetical protein [Salmonella enterica subsp. enterica]